MFGPTDRPWIMMIYPSDIDKEVGGEKGWEFYELGDLVFQADDLYSLQRAIYGGMVGRKEEAIMYISDKMEDVIAAAQDVLGPIPDHVLDQFMDNL